MNTGASRRVVITDDERELRQNKRRADLWSAVWEASQTMTANQIRDFVEGVLREIENDEP